MSPTISISEKRTIVLMQRTLLRKINLEPPVNLYGNNLEKNLNSYLDFLNQENVKQFIPSDEVMEHIKNLRAKKDKETINLLLNINKNFLMA